MEVSYSEGVAIHTGPESCVVVREGRREALTGEGAGRVLSRERDDRPGRRRSSRMRKATSDTPLSQGAFESRAVGDPVHARKHLARNPGDPVFGSAKDGGRTRNVNPKGARH